MAEPILDKLELRRLPFQRRPVAQPGTTLVFQMADGQVVAPTHPYTSGETWWKAPKWAYVVDMSPHGFTFTAELPSRAPAVFFAATVSCTWSVHDPATLVQQAVTDPQMHCRAHLVRRMPDISRDHAPLDSDAAQRALLETLGQYPIDLPNGIRLQGLHVQLRMDTDQAALAKEQEIGKLRQELAETAARNEAEIDKIKQVAALELERERQKIYHQAVVGGTDALMALVIAQNPAQAPQILETMIGLTEREKQRTLETIKILLDGDEIRPGELEGVVAAAVNRIGSMLGKQVGAPDKPALPESKNETKDGAKDGDGTEATS